MIGEAITLLDTQLCLEAALYKSPNFAGLASPTPEQRCPSSSWKNAGCRELHHQTTSMAYGRVEKLQSNSLAQGRASGRRPISQHDSH